MPIRGRGYSPTSNQDGVPAGRRRYLFDYRINGARYRKVVVCAPSQVEAIYKKWMADLLVEGPRVLLFETLDKYYAWIKSVKGPAPVAAAGYLVPRVKSCFKDMELEHFRRIHVDQYIQWRRSGSRTLKPATINRDIAALSAFFTWCQDRELYSRANPAFRSRLPERNTREVLLSRAQLQELVEKAHDLGHKFATAVYIALLAGLRKGEILALAWADIDLGQSVIRIRASTSKGYQSRVVTMPSPLRSWLARLRLEEPAQELVFWDYQTKYRLRYQFEELRDRLSFGRLNNGLTLTFHDLRRIYAQSLRHSGAELSDIKTLLGHSSVRITESRYAMFGRPDLQGIVDKIVDIIPVDRLGPAPDNGSHGPYMDH